MTAYFQVTGLIVHMRLVIPIAIPGHKSALASITAKNINIAEIVIQADELVQNEKALHAIKLRLSHTILKLYQHVYNARLLWLFLHERYHDGIQGTINRPLDNIDRERSINTIITRYRHIAAQGHQLPAAHINKALKIIRAIPLKWNSPADTVDPVTAPIVGHTIQHYTNKPSHIADNNAISVGPSVQQLAREIRIQWSKRHSAPKLQSLFLTRDLQLDAGDNLHTEYCLANAHGINKGKARCRC
jgi:hypothetical protein